MKIRILLFVYFILHAFLSLVWTDPGRRLLQLDKADELERKRFLANRASKVGDNL